MRRDIMSDNDKRFSIADRFACISPTGGRGTARTPRVLPSLRTIDRTKRGQVTRFLREREGCTRLHGHNELKGASRGVCSHAGEWVDRTCATATKQYKKKNFVGSCLQQTSADECINPATKEHHLAGLAGWPAGSGTQDSQRRRMQIPHTKAKHTSPRCTATKTLRRTPVAAAAPPPVAVTAGIPGAVAIPTAAATVAATTVAATTASAVATTAKATAAATPAPSLDP